jgi:hypothetical protein
MAEPSNGAAGCFATVAIAPSPRDDAPQALGEKGHSLGIVVPRQSERALFQGSSANV